MCLAAESSPAQRMTVHDITRGGGSSVACCVSAVVSSLSSAPARAEKSLHPVGGTDEVWNHRLHRPSRPLLHGEKIIKELRYHSLLLHPGTSSVTEVSLVSFFSVQHPGLPDHGHLQRLLRPWIWRTSLGWRHPGVHSGAAELRRAVAAAALSCSAATAEGQWRRPIIKFPPLQDLVSPSVLVLDPSSFADKVQGEMSCSRSHWMDVRGSRTNLKDYFTIQMLLLYLV